MSELDRWGKVYEVVSAVSLPWREPHFVGWLYDTVLAAGLWRDGAYRCRRIAVLPGFVGESTDSNTNRQCSSKRPIGHLYDSRRSRRLCDRR